VPLLGALLLVLLLGTNAYAAQNDTLLVSRATGPAGAGADASSYAPSISGDGDRVAFETIATNLGAEQLQDGGVFVRSLSQNTLTLVNRASGAAGPVANSSSYGATISANGRYVAFVSYATNLDPADNDPDLASAQIFVRDLQTNTTTLVSRANGAAGAMPNADAGGQAISSDGRYVVFSTSASNLTSDDTDFSEDVYVRDRVANTTTLVTRPVLNVPKGDGGAYGPTISDDGRFIAFLTNRDDLVAQGTEDEFSSDVLVKDMQTGKIELVSRASGATGAPADSDSGHPTISDDGRFVSFNSLGANLSTDDDDAFTDVFVRDLKESTTKLVTVVPGVPQSSDPAGESFADSISGDGRYITFSSTAPGLHTDGVVDPGQAEPISDIFVRDMEKGTTTLVSRATGPTGASGNDFSSASVVSADGRVIAFASVATNLDPAAVQAPPPPDDDTFNDPISNVYAREVLGPNAVPGGRSGGPPGCPFQGHLVVGTTKADVRHGGSGTDVMFGLAGSDTLRAGGGRDCVYGQAGRDRLLGQGAADWLFGGPGADRLDGGHGNDHLRGQDGADQLRGASGGDRLVGGTGATGSTAAPAPTGSAAAARTTTQAAAPATTTSATTAAATTSQADRATTTSTPATAPSAAAHTPTRSPAARARTTSRSWTKPITSRPTASGSSGAEGLDVATRLGSARHPGTNGDIGALDGRRCEARSRRYGRCRTAAWHGGCCISPLMSSDGVKTMSGWRRTSWSAIAGSRSCCRRAWMSGCRPITSRGL
jgi:Tol biopolymer transport system component